jgi:hypothetical protein
MVIVSLFNGEQPFSQPHLMFKIGIAALLVFLCETAPKPLAVGKRGAALLSMVLFLVVSFVASNHSAFIKPLQTAPGHVHPEAGSQIIQTEPQVIQKEQPEE